MNMDDLMLQMAIASQMVQNTMPMPSRDTSSKPSGEKSEFHTLLDKKRTEAPEKQETAQENKSGVEGSQQPAEQQTQPVQTVQTADASVQTMNVVQTVGVPLIQQDLATVLPGAEVAMQPAAEMAVLPQVEQTVPVDVVPQAGDQLAPEAQTTVAQNTATVTVAAEGENAQTATPNMQADTTGTAVAGQQAEGTQSVTADALKQPEASPAAEQEAPKQQTDSDSELVQTGATQQRLFADTEVMPQRVGDAQTLDTQSPDFDGQLKQTVQKMVDQGNQRIEVQLNPQNLGRLVIEMSKTPEGVLHVVLRADNEQALKLLTEHSQSLGLMLQNSQQGDVRVEVQRSPQSEQPWQQPDQDQGQNQDQAQDQRQQQEQQRRSQASENFLQQLRLGLLPS